MVSIPVWLTEFLADCSSSFIGYIKVPKRSDIEVPTSLHSEVLKTSPGLQVPKGTKLEKFRNLLLWRFIKSNLVYENQPYFENEGDGDR